MAANGSTDQRLEAALQKRQRGEKLSQRDERLLKKHDAEQAQRHGAALFEACPKGDYLELAGVSNKVILDQSERLGLPWHPHARTVDVGAMLRRLHSIITENSLALSKAIRSRQSRPAMAEFFPDEQGGKDWQEECFKERALELADKRLLRRQEMLDAQAVAEIHRRMADRDVSFGEIIGKRFGPEAQLLFKKHKEDQEADVMRLIEGPDGDCESAA
jgi:hypothetical protein